MGCVNVLVKSIVTELSASMNEASVDIMVIRVGEFSINGKVSKSAKIWLSKSIFYVKKYLIFIEEYQFRSIFFVIDIFW